MATKKRKPKTNDDTQLDFNEITNKNWDYSFRINNKFKFNYIQESFLQTLLREDTKVTFVDGPAGTSKTYIAILAGLTMLKDRKIDNIVYVRSVVESASRSMGHLPGEIEEKFAPWSAPMLEKMEELIAPTIKSNLFSKGIVKCLPVNFTRGLTFNDSLVIIDECQNLTKEEITTILTRFGKNTKYAIIGDSLQCDIRDSGFKKIVDVFNTPESDEKGIYSFVFGESEIVRSEILKFILTRLSHIS